MFSKDIKKYNNAEEGISLMDFVLWFAIVAFVMVVIVGFATSGRSQATSSKFVQSVFQIEAGVRSLAGQGRSYGTESYLDLLRRSTYLPKSFYEGSGSAFDYLHPWGGELKVDGNGREFLITIEDVPEDACIEVGTKEISTNATNINVNGNDDVNGFMTPDDIADACAAGETNTIAWTIK